MQRCQHGAVPDTSYMRRDYGRGSDDRGFREEDLAPTWVEQFDRWFADAVAAELPEPNAVVVATAAADGTPDARIVLMKGYDLAGIVFGTSYASAKGAQLAANPRAALVFPWHAMQRQVRMVGRVERIGDAASDDLWDPRPRGAQLAAVASVQSTVVESREELADVSGANLTRNPVGLMHALQKLEANDKPFASFNHATAAMCIDDPLQHHEAWYHHLFDTHPPHKAQRIDDQATARARGAGRRNGLR